MKWVRWILAGILALAVAAAASYVWLQQTRSSLPEGIAQSNGRIEAEQVQIATKLAGRVVEILANEGDMVEAGAVLARMDDSELQAQLRGAKAQVDRSEHSHLQAEATIAQRESERALHDKGYFTTERLDQRRSELNVAEAGYNAAQASLDDAAAAIDVAQAEVVRLQSLLADTVLKAPVTGRVQYKLAQPGEVLGAGAPVLTLLDLTDVYMTVFLPASAAGPLALGSEARLILDPVPQYVVPATVSFVASEAQFTPKSVETQEERDKLMFRVKLSIAPELLKQYIMQVKTGVRGVAYVRVRQDVAWPDNLAVKLP